MEYDATLYWYVKLPRKQNLIPGDLYVYVGYINGDKKNRFTDGTVVTTSLVKEEKEIDGKRYAITLNSVYLLED